MVTCCCWDHFKPERKVQQGAQGSQLVIMQQLCSVKICSHACCSLGRIPSAQRLMQLSVPLLALKDQTCTINHALEKNMLSAQADAHLTAAPHLLQQCPLRLLVTGSPDKEGYAYHAPAPVLKQSLTGQHLTKRSMRVGGEMVRTVHLKADLCTYTNHSNLCQYTAAHEHEPCTGVSREIPWAV